MAPHLTQTATVIEISLIKKAAAAMLRANPAFSGRKRRLPRANP
jgi:hypothetical protein